MGNRLLGIDFGLKRIGLALSDERKIIASPLPTFECSNRSELTAKKLVQEIERLKLNGFMIEGIVIGLPLRMSGAVSHLSDEVIHFIALLKKETELPIFTWDERLTSVQAERSLMESNMSRKKRSKVIDQVAAVIILQSYLDSLAQPL